MVCTVSVGHDANYPWSQQEDYYLGGSEPRGTNYAPTGMFGLHDGALIDRTAYFRMMDGQDPRTGDQMCKANAQGKRVSYYDVTFEAPKSVSILWALTDEQTRARIEGLHMRAVERAMDYIRQEATFTRLGKDGAQVVKTDLVAFKFQHGEARPVSDAKAAGILNEDAAKAAGVDKDALDRVNQACSDMHLHVHVAVPNVAYTVDEQGNEHWTALDGRGFFYAQKGAGAVYHAELAALLQSELGANVQFARDTTFEVEGLPQEALTHFSKRARQIQEILAEFGVAKGDSVKLAEAAQVLSRLGKEGEAAADRFARWRTEADLLGLTPDVVQAVLNRTPERPRDATDIERFDEPITDWNAARATYGRVVTETESVVSRHDLTIAAARLAIEHGRGAADVHAVVTEALDRGEVVAIGEDETIPGQAVFTTTEIRLIERRLAEVWRPDPADRRHVIPAETVEEYLEKRAAEGRALTDEQRRGVLWVTSRPGLGTALEGAAGTGKSYSNGAVVDLYRAQGYACYGASSEWLAAKVLAEEAGLAEGSSKAVAKWLADWEQGKNLPAERSLWILDEAGKSGARDLLAFTEYLKAAGARLILSGDLRQQMGVSAGPGLRIAVEQAGSFRLEKTRRMEVQADDVLVHRDGLSRKDAIAQAQAMTPDDRAALVRDHGAAAEAQADAWAANPLESIRAADVLVHVRGLSRAEAEAQAARMDPADRKALVREHHEAVARQGAIWARLAATDMSMGRAAEALEAFAAHGQLLWLDRAEDAVRAAVADWMVFRTERPGATALVIAKRNDDVAALTAEMRAWLKERGQLGAVDTEIRAVSRRGAHQLMLTTGDQIRFTRRDDKLGVVNGHLGVVLNVKPLAGNPGHATLTVRLPDDDRVIAFDTTAIADRKGRARLEHFFASTTYSVQGATKTASFGVLDAAETSNGAYVAASRAKEMTRFYVSRQNIDARLRERLPPEERLDTSRAFTDEERRAFLAKALSRAQEKTCTLDYDGEDAPAPLAPAALWRDHAHPPRPMPSAPTADRVRRAARAAANTRPRSTPVPAVPARTAAQRVQQHSERTSTAGRRSAPTPPPARRSPAPAQPGSLAVAQARARRDAADHHARGAALAAKAGNTVLAENARAAAAAERAQFVAAAVQIATTAATRREADIIGLGVVVREAVQERRDAEDREASGLAADVWQARDLVATARSECLMATTAKMEHRPADEARHLAAAVRLEQDLHTVAVRILADPTLLAQADAADIGRVVRHAVRESASAPVVAEAGRVLPDLPRAGSLVTVTDRRTGRRYEAVLVGLYGRSAVEVQRLDDGAVKRPTFARNEIAGARDQKTALLAPRKVAVADPGSLKAYLRVGTDPHRLADLLREDDAQGRLRAAAALERLEKSDRERFAERLIPSAEKIAPVMDSLSKSAEPGLAPPVRDLSLTAREDRAVDLHTRAQSPTSLRDPLTFYQEAVTQIDDTIAAQRVERLRGNTSDAARSQEILAVIDTLRHKAATQVLRVPAAREAAIADGIFAEIVTSSQTPPRYHLPDDQPQSGPEPEWEMGE